MSQNQCQQEQEVKLFTLCDQYQLYNAIQFPFNIWVIDTQSAENYNKSHIVTSINLPYNSQLSNDDIIDILDSNMGKYPNINKIYIYNNDIENTSIWLYFIRLKKIITNSCIDNNKNIKDEFYILDLDYDEFHDQYPFLCTNTNDVTCDCNEIGHDHDYDHPELTMDDSSTKSFTVPTLTITVTEYAYAEDIELDEHEYDTESSSSEDIWNDNDDQRCQEIESFFLGDGKSYPNMIIDDRLFIGDIDHAQNERILSNLGITHIVNCTSRFDNMYECSTHSHKGKGDEKLHIDYYRVCVNDCDDDIGRYFESVNEFIEKALNKDKNNKVLIHCFAGISRSSTVCIGYLMWKKKMKYEDAKLFVKKRRNVIEPNISFVKQLKNYQSKLF